MKAQNIYQVSIRTFFHLWSLDDPIGRGSTLFKGDMRLIGASFTSKEAKNRQGIFFLSVVHILSFQEKKQPRSLFLEKL